MRIDTRQLQGIIPVSMHSVIRLPDDPKFPPVEKIGRKSYFEESAIYDWLNTRSNPKGKVQPGDKLLDIAGVCRLLGRSKAWVWLNISQPKRLTTFDLSPLGNSKHLRVYMIERELREAFPALVELAGQEAA